MNGSALDSPISSLSPDSLYFESNEEEMPSGSLLTSMDFVGDSSTGSILPITAPLSNQLNQSNQQLYPISNSTLIGTTNEDVPTYETAMNNSPSMESLLDGTFVTVSNYFNPGSTSPRTAPSSPTTTTPSKTKSFFSNLLSRSTKNSPYQSGRMPPSPLMTTTSSLSHNRFSNQHASTSQLVSHRRSNSLPDSTLLGIGLLSSDGRPLSNSPFVSEANLRPSPLAPGFKSIPSTPLHPFQTVEEEETLASIGLELNHLTPLLLANSRASPLCGATLKMDKLEYILIGTSNGLFFLPANSNATMKPLNLIKRTRFKQIEILDKRSNILLAIAGRNDHVRVYALDGIKEMIRIKSAQANLSNLPNLPENDLKGKGKLISPPTALQTHSTSTASQPYPNLPLSPPPDYYNTRRASQFQNFGLPSPGRRSLSGSGSTVRGVSTRVSPTTPRPIPSSRNHSISGSKSREFTAVRRVGSSASMGKRARVESTGKRSASFGVEGRSERSEEDGEWISDHGSPVNSRVKGLVPRPASVMMARDENAVGKIGLGVEESSGMTRSLSLSEFLVEDKVETPATRSPLQIRDSNRIPIPKRDSLDSVMDDNKPLASIARRKLEARSATRATPEIDSAEDSSLLDGLTRFSFGEAIQYPPPPLVSPSASPLLTSSSNSNLSIPSSTNSPPMQSKRWSMNGVSALFGRSGPQQQFPAAEAGASPEESTVRTKARHENDVKQRKDSIEDLRQQPSIPAGSTILAPQTTNQDHPANFQSPLEYVKLARTKGSTLFKATETKKKTYLAILVGEEADRIELFTGQKSISLSLNRTFVLPASPRSISLQLQGDDLVDMYLIYQDSIFGLEPTTVRIREVGIGRAERRRRRREVGAVTTTTESEAEPISLHPADSLPSPLPNSSDISNPASRSTTPLPPITDSEDTPLLSSTQNSSDSASDSAPAAPSRDKIKGTGLFSIFTQLRFVPPVPACGLNSSYLIPPLYESHSSSTSPTNIQQYPDLLSPISLLRSQTSGPPGLFFVSKGKYNVNIVTSDGRSVIKSPIIFNEGIKEDVEVTEMDLEESYLKFEIILVNGGMETTIIGMSSKEIKVVKLDSEKGFLKAIPVEAIRKRNELIDFTGKEIQFLGMGESGLMFSEKRSSGWRVYCLKAKF